MQQPVNLITGLQRQHRKSITYIPGDGGDSATTDQYTKLITNVCSRGAIHEQFSKACELSAVSGMCLLQPYLDYTEDDPAQGTLKLKVWEYNSFLIDPYFRSPDASDAQFVWTQEYISKKEAEARFPDKIENIAPMAGTPQRYGSFYFLPENYNMARNDLMVLSYVWYKWKRKKKMLYSKTRNQFFDFAGGDGQVDFLTQNIPDLEVVEIEVPTWKLATVLNDQLLYQGDNPLGFDSCPFVPVYWLYEPHINYYDLRVRSLVRTMRDPQFLYNYRVITNNDITAATINAGWKRKIGAVANEDNLKKSGQGWDVIINEGYELSDCEKIVPSGVPESDMALGQEMANLIFRTAGIDMEDWSAQQDSQVSALTTMMKQAANLMVFQKFFDQWDFSLKLLGDKLLQIALNNWNAEKVKLLINEEPTPYFYSKVFSKYQTIVEEGVLTPTQQSMMAKNMLDINNSFGREVIPPSEIIPYMNLQGKDRIIKMLQQQEQQQSAMMQEQHKLAYAMESAKMNELMSRATANIATARERHGRSQADLGLFEERLSMISKNRAMAMKEKVEALAKLVETMQKYGELDTYLEERELDRMQREQINNEDTEKADARMTDASNQFMAQITKGMNLQNSQQML